MVFFVKAYTSIPNRCRWERRYFADGEKSLGEANKLPFRRIGKGINLGFRRAVRSGAARGKYQKCQSGLTSYKIGYDKKCNYG